MSKCWYCNNELTTGDKPKHLGICNKCYDEINKEFLSAIKDWKRLVKIEKTDIIIGDVTNPIVRNRLQIFRDLLVRLADEYGKPDEVIFEFARDSADNSLFGKEKALAIARERQVNKLDWNKDRY